ncbi:hypothetical protein CYMTET_9989 [Cymbomonas tetramitiformis]|uniref:tRNA-uridine aminocarboxypropyltransferase n=1 Tax=Cymbomonas tetramitiformis TaxID=36881 RepID=A0AAE0GQK2_9CHLO|nr:hypothetical protein CYMTET_9989 [Cymbomonas tetramitiformis]
MGMTDEQLLDHGSLTLAEFQERKKLSWDRRIKTWEKMRDPNLSGEDKHDLLCQMHMEGTRATFLCPGCWLLPFYCCCGKWHKVKPKHDVCVYIHHNEWGRGINTGICLGTAHEANVYLSGYKEHEEKMRRQLEVDPERVVILWPPKQGGDSSNAPISVTEYCERFPEAVEKGITIVAIDATWKNARNMVNRLPPHQRVYIPVGGSSSESADADGAKSGLPPSLLRPVSQPRPGRSPGESTAMTRGKCTLVHACEEIAASDTPQRWVEELRKYAEL